MVYESGYANAQLLKAVVAPDGSRHSFSYTGYNWVSGFQIPSGKRTTLTYTSWNKTT